MPFSFQLTPSAGATAGHAGVARRGRQVGALLLFKLVWVGIVTSAVWSLPWLGAAAIALHFAVEVVYFRRFAVVLPVLLTGVAGFAVDNLYALSGLLEFPAAGVFPAPVWMALLWMNFALVLEPGMDWLDARPALAALLGAVGGPLAYSAGVSLDLIVLSVAPWQAFGAIALVWAVAMPALVHVCRPGARAAQTLA